MQNLNPNEDLNLKAISGTDGQIWSLNVIDGDLFGCGSNSLTIINENGTYNIPNIRGVWSVHLLSKDLAIAGTYFGLYILKKTENKWAVERMVKKGNYSSKSMYIEHSPKGIYIWTANKENGLFRLKLSPDYSQITNSVCLNSKDLPSGYNVCINKIDEDIIIASRFGLYMYDKLNDKLVRATSLEKRLGGGKWYTYIKQDEYNNIWFVENSMLKIYTPNEKSTHTKIKEEYRLRNSTIEDFESVFVLNEQSAVVGTEDGFSLIHYMKKNQTSKLSFQIRDVYLPEKGNAIYERSYIKNNRNIVLSYIDNTIGFRYTTTNYKKLSPNLFSYRLIGSGDEKWSKYSSNNFKEFSNLHEGEYIFQVRALSDDGKSVMRDSVAFTILPPWYRSIIAYIIYFIILLLIGYYIYNHFNKKFKRQKLEFKKINQIKDNRINTLEHEKLENELKYKSDELIRSSLNIVRKNEILQNIKKEALGLNGSINDANMADLRRKVLRLINQIDENIAHDDDLKKFQDAFDSTHHDFLRLLTERFPELTKRDKLLCVYIKMDLQSKEIAPLLNISLRGVEIGRYRLRKKLMLEERENLLEFLQNI